MSLGAKEGEAEGAGHIPRTLLLAEEFGDKITLEVSEKHNDTVRSMPLKVNRDELKRTHISRLAREEARDLLTRVCDAKTRLSALRGEVRGCEEVCVLRGKLAMAENDPSEILGLMTAITVGRWGRRHFEGAPLGSVTLGRSHGYGKRGHPAKYD